MRKVNVKAFGISFLEPHRRIEQKLELDGEHSIVDKDDLSRVVDFFRENPDIVEHFNNFNYENHISQLYDYKSNLCEARESDFPETERLLKMKRPLLKIKQLYQRILEGIRR